MDSEDILSDSLELLGGKRVIEDDIIKYGPLQLSVAPKSGKAIILLADHLFSPSLFLAERIERNLLEACDKTVLELGAGTALPSLLLSTLANPPSLVVVTDHPDESIIVTLEDNVSRNKNVVSPSCELLCRGYEWGADPTPLLALLSSDQAPGFDILILSDLLHFKDSHDVLVSSIVSTLKKSPESRVHVSAGSYTKPDVCNKFVSLAVAAGLEFSEIHTNNNEGWLGTLPVNTLDRDELAARKGLCRYWIGHWNVASIVYT